jgi:putative phosphoribosyl transferase
MLWLEHQRPLEIPVGLSWLEGDLGTPDDARALVLFAHGSGSSRKSPRNRAVAKALNQRGLSTVLFDLLTPVEEREDAVDAHLRFDIELLSQRLASVTDWVLEQPFAKDFSLGYFGASTGAAAALVAAAARPREVAAVVSRGGRPDLAHEALESVFTPTLLIVGGEDHEVLALNRAASLRMPGPVRLAIIEGASHLFEEPGALDRVAVLAGDWFTQHLGLTL